MFLAQAHATMTSIEVIIRLFTGVALILTNGFFVAIEFALTRARQYTEEEFMEPQCRQRERRRIRSSVRGLPWHPRR